MVLVMIFRAPLRNSFGVRIDETPFLHMWNAVPWVDFDSYDSQVCNASRPIVVIFGVVVSRLRGIVP